MVCRHGVLQQRFSNCEAGASPRGHGRVERGELGGSGHGERQKIKVLSEVKGTGACWCSKNNRKLAVAVWLTDLARSPIVAAICAKNRTPFPSHNSVKSEYEDAHRHTYFYIQCDLHVPRISFSPMSIADTFS